MKCKECGMDIVKIKTVNGSMVCNAEPVSYWLSRHPNTGVLTPNGETVYCVLKGKPEKAHGIGYTLHTCSASAVLATAALGSDMAGSDAATDLTKNCKRCGCKMVWGNPHLPGHFHESSCNLEDWDICHDCMVDHCVATNCLECGLGNHPDCRFLDMKKHYTEED